MQAEPAEDNRGLNIYRGRQSVPENNRGRLLEAGSQKYPGEEISMMYDPVNNAPPGNRRRILLSGVHELEQVNGGAVIGSPRGVEMWKKRKLEEQRRDLHERTIALQEQAALDQANADARIKEEMRRHREELGL